MQRKLTLGLVFEYLLYLVVRLLDEVINVLPERGALAFGRFVGRVIAVVLPDRRRAAVENLTIAFGREKPKAWIERTARRSLEHVGMLAVEFLRIRRWTEEEMAERIVFEGQLPFNLAMIGGTHGICLLNSHFGCFEVSAATVKYLGFRLNLIQTGFKNPFIARYFFSRAGENTGIRTYGHKGVVQEMIRLLKAGELVAFLADQRGDAERGVFVDFFGTPAPANEVFARLAIDGEARILPLCTYRRSDGRYQSVFEDEIRIKLTGDRHQDLVNVSQQFHDLFAKWIRIAPEQGFWVQRKWRRGPSRRRLFGKKAKRPSAPRGA
jgi:Kdo2-lipid IVA lauroyltransferase/acyltransferase